MDFLKKVSFQPKSITSLKGYNMARFKDDVIAGIVVGIVALPLAVAFGIASGVTPTVGLITAVIGGFLVSALGGCSVQIEDLRAHLSLSSTASSSSSDSPDSL